MRALRRKEQELCYITQFSSESFYLIHRALCVSIKLIIRRRIILSNCWARQGNKGCRDFRLDERLLRACQWSADTGYGHSLTSKDFIDYDAAIPTIFKETYS